MLLCTFLCGCGSAAPVVYGEQFVYASGEKYFWRRSIGERDLEIESDGSHRQIQDFFTDTTMTGMVYYSEGGLEVYPVHFEGDPINDAAIKDISIGEPNILCNRGDVVALTGEGLYYENDEGELWFTDFYNKTLVCKTYRTLDEYGLTCYNPVVIAAEGVNVFVLYDGELHEYRLNFDYSVPIFTDSIIDRDVIGIFGDRQLYDGVTSKVKMTSDSLINYNMQEFTNLYYWKKDDNFNIFDYYADENDGDIDVVPSDFDGKDKRDPIIHEQWQRANIREQLQLFNENNESVCKVLYYDAMKQNTEVAAESIFVSKEMYVYENGDAFEAPFIIPLESIGDYQFSFKDMQDSSFPIPFSMIVNYAYDLIDEEGIRGYMLFSGSKVPIQYQCAGDYAKKLSASILSTGMTSAGRSPMCGNHRLGNSGLAGSKLYYDYTNHNLYQFVENDKGNYSKLLCFVGDVSGTINYDIPEIMNTSLMGKYEDGAYVHTITEEGIIYSTNHFMEDFSTGQCSGILYCNDEVLLDTGNLFTVMTARNKSYVESENDKIYEINAGKLKPVIDKPATLIHVDRHYDATFDYVLDGYIYRWQNDKSTKISSNQISLEDGFEDVFYLFGCY